MGLPASLLRVLTQRRIPYVLTLHDYWWICANAQLLTNYDQTICDGPQAFANCARCALARWGRPAFWPAFPGMAALLGARNLLLGRALSAARYCIAPTRFVADWYARHGVPVQRLVVIPHGIDIPQGMPMRAGARHTPLRVAYIGGLTWQKGVHILLEALKRCRGDVELWIAGDESADPGYIHRLKAAAPANARFLGKLSRPQVWATLAQVDALLVPSLWYETFSLVAHEAHAAGVPVIASDLGALAEVVHQGSDGLLVPAGDVSSWHTALQRLVDDSGLLPQLRGARLRPLSLRGHVDQIEGVYTRVIAAGA